MSNPGISPSQDDFPAKVYEGISIRGSLKYYRAKEPDSYWGLNLVYKNISYGSIRFTDGVARSSFNYCRNEQAYVYGMDFLLDKELGNPKNILFIDFFIGFGWRIRQREYTTCNSTRTGSAPGYLKEVSTGTSFIPPMYWALRSAEVLVIKV